ncbi:MAG: hypothetical protein GY835_06135 [bacterium]|nr:hypothetical protein [bacterium]
MRGLVKALLPFALLALACGIKTELPSQIPNTEPLGDEGYAANYRWNIDGITSMMFHRSGNIFTAIQHEDSLSIYPSYQKTFDVKPINKRIFVGLGTPLLLADGYSGHHRLWVLDDADGYIKGYHGRDIFADELEIEIQFTDPNWQDIVGIAADSHGRIFVADNAANTVYHYLLEDDAITLQGELTWGAQVSSSIRDVDVAGDYVVLLVEGSWAVRRFLLVGDEFVEEDYVGTQREFTDPIAMVGRPGVCFVVDQGDSSVWELDLEDLNNPEGGVLVAAAAADTTIILPSAIAVNNDKVYIADSVLERVVDYEKRQSP